MTSRDEARLTGVHPQLVAVIREVSADLAQDGCPIFVVEGLRTVSRQQALWQEGRDAQGKIIGRVVTYKDGVTHRSNHQPHADGWGYAVDCAFLGGDPFSETHPWQRYGDALEARGVQWGGRWSMRDLPHAERIVNDGKHA